MLRSFNKKTAPAWFALALSLFLAFAPVARVRAADHGDAPVTGSDLGADLNDCYLFLDPADNTRVIVIMTVHGFIAAGENVNFGVFDPAIRYRFEFEQTGDASPDAFADITFSRRMAVNGAPQPQTATIRFSGGIAGNATYTAPATNPSVTSATAVPQVVTDLGSNLTPAAPTGIQFFAGLTDDPFFFDIPAFGRFTASIRNGAPDPTVLQRGRDSFSGYNTLAIAFSFPIAVLRNRNNNQVGASLATQRRSPEYFNTRTGQITSFGRWVNIDRMGNPAVNVAIIPFNLKDEYNASNTVEDAAGRYAATIVATLAATGLDPTSVSIFAQLAVFRGDIIRLDFSAANTGNGGGNNIGAGFPNGRRLQDDVIDTEFFLINNRNTLGDNVNANDLTFQNVFPFLAPAQQPRDTGVEDNTRN